MGSLLETRTSPSSRKIIGSVQRALDILDLFDKNHVELGNTEIARLMDLPTGTAAGLIYTLRINNYLDQNPNNRKYRLGLKLAERAAVLLDQLDLRKVAAPLLEELRDWCGESINLAIRDGTDVVYIERMFGNHALGIRSELGRRGPLHSTALGKAIVAFLPESDAQKLIAKLDFSPVTPFTITNPVTFTKELEKIRQQGFSIDEQENELGGRCVGAPILNHLNYPVASISISVPLQRFPEKDVEKFGKKLIETAKQISQKMGQFL